MRPARRAGSEQGFALALALFTLLIFFGSLALVLGTWQADMVDLDRERADSHLVALTDAGVDLARATLVADPAYLGELEREIGSGRVEVEVVADAGSWRRLYVEASWRRHRRRTLVDLAREPGGPRVLGWLPPAVDPAR